MFRLLFVCLLLFGSSFGCEKFNRHIQKFCTFAGESASCTKPNALSFANQCCNAPNKCTSLEFPLNDVCCFTQECLDRCYPGKGHRTGSVY